MMATMQFAQFLYSILLGTSILLSGLGSSQAEFEIRSEEPIYAFGDHIDFVAVISPADQIEEVLLFLQDARSSDIQVHPVFLDEGGNASLNVDLTEFPLSAFSDVEYWYQVNSIDGGSYAGSRNHFVYLDNRYDWRMLDSEPFKIHWYAGELDFAEQVLDIVWAGYESVQDLMPVFFPESLDIYVYEDPQAMQDALPETARYWTAGHADPALGVVLVSLPPGPDQQLEMERQIPHELMHIALYYTDANAYTNLPAWFNEGLASLAELYPDPEYQSMLERAYDIDQLLPLASLCTTFPIDSQDALLAYAESASFTAYLHDQFGDPGLNKLMAAYASGLDCGHGVESALGTDLTNLENSWLRANFAGNLLMNSLQEFLPWLIILLVILAGPIIVGIVIIRKRPTRIEL
jgi:hypothetical protein